MSISTIELAPQATEVVLSDSELTVSLADGRKVVVPLSWFPRLVAATAEERSRWEILGNGEGIHWPDVDEDLSVAGLLRGVRVPQRHN
jgi:hypothetical protein